MRYRKLEFQRPIHPVETGPPRSLFARASAVEETKQKRADEYRLVLFNDPLNKREYVARRDSYVRSFLVLDYLGLRPLKNPPSVHPHEHHPCPCVSARLSSRKPPGRCLMTICLLKEGDAYQAPTSNRRGSVGPTSLTGSRVSRVRHATGAACDRVSAFLRQRVLRGHDEGPQRRCGSGWNLCI